MSRLSEFIRARWSRGASRLAPPESDFLISRRARLVYCPVPKVVCSNLKKWLLAIEGLDREHPHEGFNRCRKHGEIHTCALRELSLGTLPPEEAHAALTQGTFLRFVFVRNPWSRLVSAFADKFCNETRPLDKIGEFQRRTILAVCKRNGFDPERFSGISFRQFVELVGDQEDDELDPHWRPQYRFLGNHPFDFVGRFERFDADFVQLKSQLGPTPLIDDLSNTVGYRPTIEADRPEAAWSDLSTSEMRRIARSAGGYPDYRAFYTPHLTDLVERRFQHDVERFDYRFGGDSSQADCKANSTS